MTEPDPPTEERLEAMARRIQQLEIALHQSLKLQSHYAELLNMYDEGARMTFDSIDAWLQRIDRV